jgi:hypothetical protein
VSAQSDFSKTEEAHIRGALNFLHRRCGTWAILGRALRLGGPGLCTIAKGHRSATPTLAVRLAKLAGVGVDDVLSGKFPSPGTCPHCGHCKAEPS